MISRTPPFKWPKDAKNEAFSMTKTTFSGWCPASGIVVGGLGLLCAKYHHSDPSNITTSGRQKFPRAASTAAEESERGPQNHEGPTEPRQGYNADGKKTYEENIKPNEARWKRLRE